MSDVIELFPGCRHRAAIHQPRVDWMNSFYALRSTVTEMRQAQKMRERSLEPLIWERARVMERIVDEATEWRPGI